MPRFTPEEDELLTKQLASYVASQQLDGSVEPPPEAALSALELDQPAAPSAPVEDDAALDFLVERAGEVSEQHMAGEPPPPPGGAAQFVPQPPTDPKAAGDHYGTADPTGAQNVLGIESELKDTPDARIARLRQMIGSQKQQGPQSGAAEREFTGMHERVSDADVRRAWVLMTLGGNPGDNFRMVEMLRGQQREYDEGLAKARERDAQGAPIDQATMEYLVRTGVSPEAAIQATRGSDVMQLARNPYLFSSELKRQNKEKELVVKETSDLYQNDSDNAAAAQRSGMTAQNRLDVQALRNQAKKGSGKGGGAAGPAPAELANYLYLVYGQGPNAIPFEKIQAFTQGALDPSDPAFRPLDASRSAVNSMGPDNFAKAWRDEQSRTSSTVETNTRASQNPMNTIKAGNELDKIRVPFVGAYMAVNDLNKSGKLGTALSVGPDGWGELVKRGTLTNAERDRVGAIYQFISAYAFGEGGKQLTGGERAMLEQATGVALDSTGAASLLRSPTLIVRFMKTYKHILQAREARVGKQMPGAVE